VEFGSPVRAAILLPSSETKQGIVAFGLRGYETKGMESLLSTRNGQKSCMGKNAAYLVELCTFVSVAPQLDPDATEDLVTCDGAKVSVNIKSHRRVLPLDPGG